MFKQVLCLALAIASVSSHLDFQNCGGASEVQALRIAGCDSSPCRFQRGQEYYGEVDVRSGGPSSTLPGVLEAIIGFPYPTVTLSSGDACGELVNGSCPVEVGKDITTLLHMNFPIDMPRLSTTVRATLRDNLNTIHTCVQFLVTVE